MSQQIVPAHELFVVDDDATMREALSVVFAYRVREALCRGNDYGQPVVRSLSAQYFGHKAVRPPALTHDCLHCSAVRGHFLAA
jgi:hypothetical protein